MNISLQVTRDRGMLFIFTNNSTEVPEGSQYLWDFGDLSVSEEQSPQHRYSEVGTYNYSLTITTPQLYVTVDDQQVAVDEPISETKTGVLEIYTKTVASLSIEDIATGFIPSVLLNLFLAQKSSYIDKWLLYIQPLVNHDIPEEYYYMEQYYEALEIQLIAEMVAYDFLVFALASSLVETVINGNNSITTTDSESDESSNEIKKIVTGPTEVEMYSSAESAAKMAKAIQDIRKSGGTLDTMKLEICQLAYRLMIFLPMCPLAYTQVTNPEVIRR